MSCDEDCPGDATNPAVVEAVKALLQAQIGKTANAHGIYLSRSSDRDDQPL